MLTNEIVNKVVLNCKIIQYIFIGFKNVYWYVSFTNLISMQVYPMWFQAIKAIVKTLVIS